MVDPDDRLKAHLDRLLGEFPCHCIDVVPIKEIESDRSQQRL